METKTTERSMLVYQADVPSNYIEKIIDVFGEEHLPDIRFFQTSNTEDTIPRSPAEAIELMENAGVKVQPGIEVLFGARNFFSALQITPTISYFALITPQMLFGNVYVNTFRLLRELQAHELHCDGVRTALFRSQYIAQHRHVELFIQVASGPLKDEYILCMSNTFQGNHFGIKQVTLSSTEHPLSHWLITL